MNRAPKILILGFSAFICLIISYFFVKNPNSSSTLVGNSGYILGIKKFNYEKGDKIIGFNPKILITLDASDNLDTVIEDRGDYVFTRISHRSGSGLVIYNGFHPDLKSKNIKLEDAKKTPFKISVKFYENNQQFTEGLIYLPNGAFIHYFYSAKSATETAVFDEVIARIRRVD